MASHENPASPYLTYRMEVSPTGQGPSQGIPHLNDPVALLHLMVNLQNQTLDIQRQILENQKQQVFDLAHETAQVNREQRARQIAELERWQTGHENGDRPLQRIAHPSRTGPRRADGETGELRRGTPRKPPRRRLRADRLRQPFRASARPPQHHARRPPPARRGDPQTGQQLSRGFALPRGTGVGDRGFPVVPRLSELRRSHLRALSRPRPPPPFPRPRLDRHASVPNPRPRPPRRGGGPLLVALSGRVYSSRARRRTLETWRRNMRVLLVQPSRHPARWHRCTRTRRGGCWG